jgi:hypothetical protein
LKVERTLNPYNAAVPSVDFWLDWRPTASVDRLRRILPAVAQLAGLSVVERELLTSGPGWAMLDLLDPATGPGPVGGMRAQDLPGGGSQLLIAPGDRRDQAALAALNRGALALYCGLLARGLLAPPAPLEPPARPLVAPEA